MGYAGTTKVEIDIRKDFLNAFLKEKKKWKIIDPDKEINMGNDLISIKKKFQYVVRKEDMPIQIGIFCGLILFVRTDI